VTVHVAVSAVKLSREASMVEVLCGGFDFDNSSFAFASSRFRIMGNTTVARTTAATIT